MISNHMDIGVLKMSKNIPVIQYLLNNNFTCNMNNNFKEKHFLSSIA